MCHTPGYNLSQPLRMLCHGTLLQLRLLHTLWSPHRHAAAGAVASRAAAPPVPSGGSCSSTMLGRTCREQNPRSTLSSVRSSSRVWPRACRRAAAAAAPCSAAPAAKLTCYQPCHQVLSSSLVAAAGVPLGGSSSRTAGHAASAVGTCRDAIDILLSRVTWPLERHGTHASGKRGLQRQPVMVRRFKQLPVRGTLPGL